MCACVDVYMAHRHWTQVLAICRQFTQITKTYGAIELQRARMLSAIFSYLL